VIEYPLLLIFPAAMAFAGAMDLLTMTIPNRISIALVAAFLIMAPVAGLGWSGILVHLAAGGLVLLAGIAMFAAGWMGGGDAKLLAAAALWLGFDLLLPYFAQVAVLGGVLAVSLLAFRAASFIPFATLPPWAERLRERSCGIPYGIAIGGAALLVYPQTPWFVAFST
jgi:prepilin peptidase CpaA